MGSEMCIRDRLPTAVPIGVGVLRTRGDLSLRAGYQSPGIVDFPSGIFGTILSAHKNRGAALIVPRRVPARQTGWSLSLIHI